MDDRTFLHMSTNDFRRDSNQVKRLMMSDAELSRGFPQNGTVVLAAIRGGSIPVLKAVLAGLNQHLTPDQVHHGHRLVHRNTQVIGAPPV